MHNIQPTGFGIQMTFSGFIQLEEFMAWRQEAAGALLKIKVPFGVLVDAREAKAFPDEVWPLLVESQAMFRDAGMIRSAVILSTPLSQLQFHRMARASGIFETERTFFADQPNWLERALDWIEHGIEP